MKRKKYPTDLTDAQWKRLEPLVPQPLPGGRPPAHPRRELIDAMLYWARAGGAWRLLPGDLPPWQTVYHYFNLWRNDGTWRRIHDTWRGDLRAHLGRDREPSAAVLDSQAVKTGGPGEAVGYDAGKKSKGRKRHLVVDLLGLPLVVAVTSAALPDREGACLALAPLAAGFRRLRVVFADSAYSGSTLFDWCWCELRRWRKVFLGVVHKAPAQQGFQVLPQRWIVERTFAWWLWWRRLSKDYEKQTATSEALIHLVMSRLMLGKFTEKYTSQTSS